MTPRIWKRVTLLALFAGFIAGAPQAALAQGKALVEAGRILVGSSRSARLEAALELVRAQYGAQAALGTNDAIVARLFSVDPGLAKDPTVRAFMRNTDDATRIVTEDPDLVRLVRNAGFRESFLAPAFKVRPAPGAELMACPVGGRCALTKLHDQIASAATRAANGATLDPATLVELRDLAVGPRAIWFDRLNQVGGSSTTSLRKEVKYVRYNARVEEELGTLRTVFGDAFSLRDNVLPGTMNRTYTTYARPIRFQIRNPETGEIETRVAKFRARRYEVVDATTGELINRAPVTGDSQFVEFKIDSGVYDGVVTKHRMRVLDADVEILRDPNAFWAATRNTTDSPIVHRVRKGNRSDNFPVIDGMFETIGKLHQEGQSLEAFVDVAYNRSSYEIALRAQDGTFVKVQITVDKNVTYYDPVTKAAIGRYPERARVVEIKVPLKYSGLTPADLEAVPGLDRIKTFVENLETRGRSIPVPDSEPGLRYATGDGKFINYRDGNFEVLPGE